jgi:hypothetical protein
MKTCKMFLARPFGGKPFSSYAVGSGDVREFFVKIYFEEKVWAERLKEDAPFDADLKIKEVSRFSNGAIVKFECEDWVLRVMKDRYEPEQIEINSVGYDRRQMDDGTGHKFWDYIDDDGKSVFTA